MKVTGTAFALAAIVGLATAPEAQAGVITVDNPSFETLPPGGLPIDGCGPGCFYDEATPIPGWVTAGYFSGQFQPGPSSGNLLYFNHVPNGLTVAYSNGGTISQTVGATAIAGDTYTLSVDVGFRKDYPDNGIVELVIGTNTILASGTILQGSGNWADWTASYTATLADAGAPISIWLISNGAQGDWDNVCLTQNGGSCAVPEPLTFSLFGAGLVGALAMRRRKRKSA